MKMRTRIVIGASVLLLGGLLAVPFLIPLNTYRAPIEAAASKALGRDVHIKGPLHLALYPEIGLSVGDVSIANVPGAHDAEMAGVKSMVVGAKLMPLFSRSEEHTSELQSRF